MNNQVFNLVTDPWIKVIDKTTNQDKEVSLTELFENAQHYRRLAGEMRSQDLAILRFLLAILTTVYSRVDADGVGYEWLEIDTETLKIINSVDEDDYDQSDLQETWQQLFQQGHFSKIVTQYLKRHQKRFDLFGEQPFYQVTADEYDAVVSEKKKVATGSGTVSVKQINRLISESNNTPDIFTPKTDGKKNQVLLDELVRWLIMYQNFTGVTDKTKVDTNEKFSTPSGWLYKLNPVFANGATLFETLMLNLILFTKKEYVAQKPVWEYENLQDYVANRKKLVLPDDLAGLYTAWSRVLHIEWDEQNQPTIFSAGLPMFSNKNAFVEPMTTWKPDLQGGTEDFKPAVKSTRSLGIAMWRNFGQYVNVDKSTPHEPGIVSWLHILEKKGMLASNRRLNLATAVLVSDGNATSQAPVAEIADDLVVKVEVLFDTEGTHRWPERIENIIDLTQQIGKDYWQFVVNMGQIRNLDSRQFASQYSAKFYDRLNEPFKQWLAGLSNDDNRDEKELEWQRTLKKIVLRSAEEFMNSSTSRDIKGITAIRKDKSVIQNIFTSNNDLRYNLKRHLNL
ncbi:CRISPR-associated protein [Liquorilactobacillus sucicola DSM 21376 = JCM 15457]|uniref:type I-E CRISPR-associated protein Cse1/CasA n=1 Tax=Liquorilactobacillus sucicola TaxID=519050 RepID=UPI0004338434|nr:type I-E CRISPR-associated protein Cse1/CasA [Liquorilactobacillus sucicola]GAJ26881.1 CRISPR-associated protein [Liquorilactobacillus sucicola DSM 21376 = JCM 15457]